MRRIFETAGAVIMTALALAACSAQSDSDNWDPVSVASSQQHAAAMHYTLASKVLSDGKVTAAEWLEMHMGWRACMEKVGFSYPAPQLDPVNGREYMESGTYHGAGAGATEKQTSPCDNEYDFSVGQIYYEDNPAHMAPGLLSATRKCLTAHQIKYTGHETKLEDFFAQSTSSQSAAKSPTWACVKTSYFKLYPNLKVIGFGF